MIRRKIPRPGAPKAILVVLIPLIAVAVLAWPLVYLWPRVQCFTAAGGLVCNGEAVMREGVAMGIEEEGIVAALVAGLQETGLRNLANPRVPETLGLPHDGLAADHRAVGILALNEQWGTPAELMSPDAAARKWFTAMRGIAGWQAMAPQQVAAAVMHSALPDTYTGRLDEARQFYRKHLDAVTCFRCYRTPTFADRPVR